MHNISYITLNQMKMKIAFQITYTDTVSTYTILYMEVLRVFQLS